MSNAPHISVIMPAFNACETIDRAIASVQQQTHQQWELIIIDDGSNDDTPSRIKHHAELDNRIIPIYLPQNQGQSHARNQGIAQAKGAWITLLDADDAYSPSRLETLLSLATTHRLDMIADNLTFFDAYLQQEVGSALKVKKNLISWTVDSHLTHDRVGYEFKWGLLKAFINADYLRKHDILYREQFRMAEDSLFYLELLTTGAQAAISPQPTYIYTSSIGAISGQPSGFSTSYYRLEEHLRVFDYYQQHYEAVLLPSSQQLLHDCRHDAIAADDANSFKHNLRHGKHLLRTLAMPLHNPRLIKHLALSVKKRIKRFVRKLFCTSKPK